MIEPGQATESETTIALDGYFNSDAACRASSTVLSAPSSSHVRLDFRRVRSIDDAALAILANSLRRALPRVALCGLSHHQEVILRYLGVDTGP